MAVVEYGGWSMVVPQKVADDAEARAQVVALLQLIVKVDNSKGESEIEYLS